MPERSARLDGGPSALIQVREVATAGDRRRFISYPYKRNQSDPHWTPPLRLSERERLMPSKNPFFAHADVTLFLAWRSGDVVGRIAAIDDRLHNETHRENVAMFGFFEADDRPAAMALLGAVEQWSLARGRDAVRGPMNPSTNESVGLLIQGFDTHPMLLMPHNRPEYAAFIESAGYTKVKDLYAWIYNLEHGVEPTMAKIAARLRDRHGMTVRKLRLDEFDRELERLRAIYCGAWARNWGFVPPTPEEFQRLARELRPIFDPRCAVCAEVEGTPVACAIALPDINQVLNGTGGRLFPLGLIRLLARRWIIDQIRLLLLGVLPEYRAYGLYPVMIDALHRQVYPAYRRIEFSWVLEDNHDINGPLQLAGARRYKTYRIYEKRLT
jgi:hypothetical protein